jgi:hypothetical protein
MHVIQQILGHAQITTTRRYTDPTNPERASSLGARQPSDQAGEAWTSSGSSGMTALVA